MRVAEKPGALRAIAVFFAHSGDSWFWAIGLFAIWISGNSFWKEWAVVQLAGISLLAALVMSIKFLVRRRRPEGEWGSIYRNTDPHSFPSGHAARAFLIAVVATGLGSCLAGNYSMDLGATGCTCAGRHGCALYFGYGRRRGVGDYYCTDRFADIPAIIRLGFELLGFPFW